MKVHHIGYAVENLQAAVKALAKLGSTPQSEVVADAARNVSFQFAHRELGILELVETCAPPA